MKQFIEKLGIDGLIFGLTGLIAVAFSIIGFFGLWPFDQLQTSQILVGAMGALMLAVVALMSKRHAEIIALKEAVGVSNESLVDYHTEYYPHLVTNTLKSKRHISEMFVNWAVPRPGESYLQNEFEYHRLIYNFVNKGKLKFRQVQVIHHRQALEEVIHRILLHEGKEYYIRHYYPPPVSIPMIHMVSIDDERFYLGVGYPKGEPADNQVLYIDNPKLGQVLKSYWRTFWDDAILLHEGGHVYWEELKQIGVRLDINENEFESMVEKVRKQVRIDKQRYKLY